MKKTEFLTVRITTELKSSLKTHAERLDRTVGWVVNQALRQYLSQEVMSRDIKENIGPRGRDDKM